jgi:hypothetical protein
MLFFHLNSHNRRTWNVHVQGRCSDNLTTKKLLDDAGHEPGLQRLLQEEDLVKKELTKQQLLDRQLLHFLRCLEAREDVDSKVELDL